MSLNRKDILYKFHILCALFLKEILLMNENDLSMRMRHLFSGNFFTWTVYFILFRTVLSSLIVTLLDESRQICDFTNILICIPNLDLLNAKPLSNDLKQKIYESFEDVLKKKPKAKDLFEVLDGNSGSLEEEIKIVSALIPEFVIIHSKTYFFAGKTLLGGFITIINEAFPIRDDIISEAAFILIMRHEICHRKWLLNGSKGKFRMRIPFDNDSFQDAGTSFDKIAFEMIDPNKLFAISGINQNIARKILSQENAYN